MGSWPANDGGMISKFDSLSFNACFDECQAEKFCEFFSYATHGEKQDNSEYGLFTNCLLYQNRLSIEDAKAEIEKAGKASHLQRDIWGHMGCYSRYQGYFKSIFLSIIFKFQTQCGPYFLVSFCNANLFYTKSEPENFEPNSLRFKKFLDQNFDV